MFTKRKAQGCSTPICLEAIDWSKAIYYRWLRRYQEQGWQGLETQSKHPHATRIRQWTKQLCLVGTEPGHIIDDLSMLSCMTHIK